MVVKHRPQTDQLGSRPASRSCTVEVLALRAARRKALEDHRPNFVAEVGAVRIVLIDEGRAVIACALARALADRIAPARPSGKTRLYQSPRDHGSQNQPRREPSRLAPPTSGGVSSVSTFETECTAFPARAGWCDAIRTSALWRLSSAPMPSGPRQCACDDSTASIYKYVPYGSNFGKL